MHKVFTAFFSCTSSKIVCHGTTAHQNTPSLVVGDWVENVWGCTKYSFRLLANPVCHSERRICGVEESYDFVLFLRCFDYAQGDSECIKYSLRFFLVLHPKYCDTARLLAKRHHPWWWGGGWRMTADIKIFSLFCE